MESIKYLQNIQENLVGIVLPVVITAAVSLITVLVNAILQIMLQNSKANWEQYKIMQDFYPNMKLNLLRLRVAIQEVEHSPLCTDLKEASVKYAKYKSDEAEYRKKNDNEVQDIDVFISMMEDFSNRVREINEYLINCTLPRPPILHPILKIKVNRMLANLQYAAFFWDEYYNKTIDVTVFQMEIEKQLKKKFNSKKVKKYICLLDRWFFEY